MFSIAPLAANCDFIYRLEYEKDHRYLRLPMTVNVVYYLPGSASANWSDCKVVARDLNDWMLAPSSPFPEYPRQAKLFKSLEINLQVLRAPSSVLPDMGGHAEYLLRVFHRAEGQSEFVNATLENTPDVDRLKKDQALKAEFLKFIQDLKNLRRLNAGILVLPEKFLATKASSYSHSEK